MIQQAQFNVQMAEEDRWLTQYPNMEMIVNNKGPKPIFPELNFNITGLEEKSRYVVLLSIQKFDNIRYGFKNGKWGPSKVRHATKKEQEIKYFLHPDGTKLGEELMKETIKFDTVRITNHKKFMDKDNVFFVETMHKYVPVLTVKNITNVESANHSMRMEVAQFFPVTVYNQESIGNWKSKFHKNATFENRLDGGNKRKNTNSREEPSSKRSKNETEIAVLDILQVASQSENYNESTNSGRLQNEISSSIHQFPSTSYQNQYPHAYPTVNTPPIYAQQFPAPFDEKQNQFYPKTDENLAPNCAQDASSLPNFAMNQKASFANQYPYHPYYHQYSQLDHGSPYQYMNNSINSDSSFQSSFSTENSYFDDNGNPIHYPYYPYK
ncbi:Putative T-box protein 40 [Caenorhabditis elegans]|uniref:Putative T-box protein 40 n=1 Tax=Caenorhabditis elegans TaxID=6239 RepID=TBX40_CAEEL|nr:Putative T-box protein 40 [Caenorhabditis elegans]Q9NA55.1 RecName: Full=Putative T-box protein 40 [Caenorhabditis elegans]CAB60542.1 Putative T-box protein 40 [Caenorhabditis elegans]|eukprot:NP_502852.1 Putative T-box protein 40 [Caenorhabditis elegans]